VGTSWRPDGVDVDLSGAERRCRVGPPGEPPADWPREACFLMGPNPENGNPFLKVEPRFGFHIVATVDASVGKMSYGKGMSYGLRRHGSHRLTDRLVSPVRRQNILQP
jgi:hypothetical protein